MRNAPRQAFILAAGFGTRMGPLSQDLPKAIMPVWNRSLLARQVDLLMSWGVKEILINLHHGADQVFDEARRLTSCGCRIELSFEPEILGTGGAIRRASWFLGRNPFWLINADVVAQLDPMPLLRALKTNRTMAALWMEPVCGPRTVAVQQGQVSDFRSRDGVTFCGLHLVRPDILSYLPDTGFASIITAYEQAMRAGWKVAAVQVPGSYWADVGTPDRYLQAHWQTSPAERYCRAPTAIIHSTAKVERSVIWPDSVIAAHAQVKDAVIGRRVRVQGKVSGVIVAAQQVLDASETAALISLGWQVDRTSVQVLPPRGSARSFFRLRDARRRAILVRYDAARIENVYYAPLTRFLSQQGWPVPALLWDDATTGRSIYADAGESTLPVREAAYRKVLDALLTLQGPVTHAFRRQRVRTMRPFDADTYEAERFLFCDLYLKAHKRYASSLIRKARAELEEVAAHLIPASPVLVHRDLQSSNIHWRRGQPICIDYQGMRLGAAAYDVASLLYDPYAQLTPLMQQRLLAYYTARNPSVSPDLPWAAVQRLCQAVGAYVRLSQLPGCAAFQKHIPAALEQLQRPLAQLPALSVLGQIARDKAHQ